MSERLAPESKFSMRSLRRLPRLALGSVLVFAACTSGSDQSPTVWNDPGLGGEKSDRGLTSVQIRLDPGSSVLMETCFKDKGEFRIVSEEMSPRPGYLVDKTYPHEAQCYVKYPVSPIDDEDIEKIYLGLDNTYGNGEVDLSTNVRVYRVERIGNTLKIETLSPKDLGKPGTLKMRDATQ